MNYLYIISKQEFTSLYRFGHLPVRLNQIIDTINKSPQEIDNEVFENLKSLAAFVGDEEYLIISFPEDSVENNFISIENVIEIIPMTKASKSSLAMKFDARIDFGEPRFEEVYRKIEEYVDINERFKGAKAFCKLSKVNNPFLKLVDDEVIVNSYYLRLNDGRFPKQNSYYTQLLAYERYEFFPNTDLGYFYDAGEVYAQFKGLPTFVGSNFYNYLQSNKEEYSNKSFIEITDIICNADEIKNFTESLTNNSIREFVVAAIFQKFKSDLRERDSIIGSETGLSIGVINKDKQYIDELNVAVYLTGAFFGYKKFYDDLYSKIDLKIFKKEKELDINLKLNNENIDNPKFTTDNNRIVPEKSNSLNIQEMEYQDNILINFKRLINSTTNGQLKIGGDILKEIKQIFKPAFKNKQPTIKEIINFVQKEYPGEFEVHKKDTVSLRIEAKLF